MCGFFSGGLSFFLCFSAIKQRGDSLIVPNPLQTFYPFGEESKIELINGKITIGDRSFDEVIEKYLQIKAIKKSGNS